MSGHGSVSPNVASFAVSEQSVRPWHLSHVYSQLTLVVIQHRINTQTNTKIVNLKRNVENFEIILFFLNAVSSLPRCDYHLTGGDLLVVQDSPG